MDGIVEIPLHEMIKQLGESHAKEILSDFSCPKNKDVEYFLHNRAIEFAKQSITQTQLIFMQHKGEPRLVGYYSLTQKSISVKDEGLSSKLRRRFAKFGTRDVLNRGYVLPAPLIAQLGKNYTDELNHLITGDELLHLALEKVKEGQMIFGGKIVYVECEETPRLVEYYTRNGFKEFGKRDLVSEDIGRVAGKYLVQLLKIND